MAQHVHGFRQGLGTGIRTGRDAWRKQTQQAQCDSQRQLTHGIDSGREMVRGECTPQSQDLRRKPFALRRCLAD
ncbi:MAG: hypothetical protein BWZ07_02823 [Alphaproteobacteria bacterium ADurb.BinA280]|nr:MAG: hypothetical protein BWZ07_02823 [Alphaproteobacteria bacterium ADurb.BinA280]